MKGNARKTFEIIGPPGAGKSSLSRILNEKCSHIVAGISIWKLPRVLLTRSLIGSVPKLARVRLHRVGRSYDEEKQLVRLEALYRKLNSSDSAGRLGNAKAFFFDEGPVFAFSKLRVDRQGPDETTIGWEESFLDRWSDILDGVIFLDASNETLIERIRGRRKDHRIKFKDDAAIIEFLDRYRAAYYRVIRELKERGDLRAWKFSTDRIPLAEIGSGLIELADDHPAVRETH